MSSIGEVIKAAIVGVTLGSPHIGRNSFQRLLGFTPIPHRMSANSCLDAWLVWLKVKQNGIHPEVLYEKFLDELEDNGEETAYGLMNLKRGFGSPLSGKLDNPLCLGSRGILRSVIWGFFCKDDPSQAAKFAYYDSAIDHCEDGVWIPTALAFALAHPSARVSMTNFWNVFTTALPSQSQFHKIAPYIRESIGSPEAPQFFAQQFEQRFPGVPRDSAAASAAFIFLGLLHSNNQTEQAMLISAGCGGQTDVTAGVTALIAATLWDPLPSEYLDSLEEAFVGTFTLRHINLPPTVSDFVEEITRVIPADGQLDSEYNEVVEGSQELVPEIFDTESGTLSNDTSEPQEVPSETADGLALELNSNVALNLQYKEVENLLSTKSDYFYKELEGMLIKIAYFDPPLAFPPAKNLAITLENRFEEKMDCAVMLSCPAGWKLASKVSDSVLEPGSSVTFPVVVQPGYTAPLDTNLRLKVNQFHVLVPFTPAQTYWVVGPFLNTEGTGFSQELPPEKVSQKIQQFDQAFSGRSNIGLRWETRAFTGCTFDIEDVFNGGEGVAFLYANLAIQNPGMIRINAIIQGGLKIWIDNKQTHSYNDLTLHDKDYSSYNSEFYSAGQNHILIKIVRGKIPVGPLRLTFFDESGRVIMPGHIVN